MNDFKLVSLLKTAIKDSFLKKIIKVETQPKYVEFDFKPNYKVKFTVSPSSIDGLFFVDIEYYNTIIKKEFETKQLKDSVHWYYSNAIKGHSPLFSPQINIALSNPLLKLNNKVFIISNENECKLISGIPFYWTIDKNKFYETEFSKIFVILSPFTNEWHILSGQNYYNVPKENHQKFLYCFQNGLDENICEMIEKNIQINVTPFLL